MPAKLTIINTVEVLQLEAAIDAAEARRVLAAAEISHLKEKLASTLRNMETDGKKVRSPNWVLGRSKQTRKRIVSINRLRQYVSDKIIDMCSETRWVTNPALTKSKAKK
jgi:hypothetical protein